MNRASWSRRLQRVGRRRGRLFGGRCTAQPKRREQMSMERVCCTAWRDGSPSEPTARGQVRAQRARRAGQRRGTGVPPLCLCVSGVSRRIAEAGNRRRCAAGRRPNDAGTNSSGLARRHAAEVGSRDHDQSDGGCGCRVTLQYWSRIGRGATKPSQAQRTGRNGRGDSLRPASRRGPFSASGAGEVRRSRARCNAREQNSSGDSFELAAGERVGAHFSWARRNAADRGADLSSREVEAGRSGRSCGEQPASKLRPSAAMTPLGPLCRTRANTARTGRST